MTIPTHLSTIEREIMCAACDSYFADDGYDLCPDCRDDETVDVLLAARVIESAP